MRLLASAGELLTIKENAVLRMEPVGTSSELEPLPSAREISFRLTRTRCKKPVYMEKHLLGDCCCRAAFSS